MKVTPLAQTRETGAAMPGLNQSLSQGVSVNLCDASLAQSDTSEVFVDIGSFRQSQVHRNELSWLRLVKSTLSENLGDDPLFHLRLRREDDGPAVERTAPRDSDVSRSEVDPATVRFVSHFPGCPGSCQSIRSRNH